MFKGIIIKKWVEAQGIYYAANPDTQAIVSFYPPIWNSKTIQVLLEMALDLWGARNKLYGITSKKKNSDSTWRSKNVVSTKYAEGFRNVQA